MKKFLSFLSIGVFIFFLTSCNSPAENKAQLGADSTTPQNSSQNNVALQALPDGFPNLLMSRTDADRLFGKGGSDKKRRIVFQVKSLATGSSPIMIAFGAKKIDEYDLADVVNLTSTGISVTLFGDKVIGNLDLPKKKYKDLLALPGGGSSTHLYFEPVLVNEPTSTTTPPIPYLKYKVSLVTVAIPIQGQPYEVKNIVRATPETFLNPCPPKKPCGDGVDCDADTQN
jgi:hypothetical protein